MTSNIHFPQAGTPTDMPAPDMRGSNWLQTPHRKVSAGAMAGAMTVVLVWVLNTYVLADPIPSHVAAAITTLLTFMMSYMVPAANAA